MKKNNILWAFVLLCLGGCNDKQAVTKSAKGFLESLSQQDSLSPAFLGVFGLSQQSELKNLKVESVVPIVDIDNTLFDGQHLNDFVAAVASTKATQYLVKYTHPNKQISSEWIFNKDSTQNSLGQSTYLMVAGGSSTCPILNCRNCFVNIPISGTTRNREVPVGLPPFLISFEAGQYRIYCAVVQVDRKLFVVPTANAFSLENEGYALRENTPYPLETVYKIVSSWR